MSDHKAVVLLSGGQDSTTCFYWALQRDLDLVAAVGFDYGQRHAAELGLARRTAEKNGVPWITLPVPALQMMAPSSLVHEGIRNYGTGTIRNRFAEHRGLPSSFTPGRNLLFFSMGAAECAALDADTLISGVCQQDRSGYPDCRAEFVVLMEAAIREGFDWPEFNIKAPLLYASKAETWSLAGALGIVQEIVENTNTCYEGDRTVLHEWGYGCGKCGACIERKRGFEECFAEQKVVQNES